MTLLILNNWALISSEAMRALMMLHGPVAQNLWLQTIRLRQFTAWWWMIEYVLQSNMLQTPYQCSCCFDLYTFWDKRIVRKIGSPNVDPGPKARKTGHPVPEMSAKKVIFHMENCGHLPAEVCGVLGRFVRKSTQAGNFFCADVRNISICRSAVVRREVRGSLHTSLRTSVRTSAWIGVDVRMDWCGRPHGWVRMSADVCMDGCGHPQGQRIC